jgi:hypothetical protein
MRLAAANDRHRELEGVELGSSPLDQERSAPISYRGGRSKTPTNTSPMNDVNWTRTFVG